MPFPPKKLYLPPPGRPRWVCPPSAQLELLYLAWGRRFFGRNPIPMSRHDGWVYAFVGAGQPVLTLWDRRRTLSPGTMTIIGPECASGWADDDDRGAELLVWMWRHPSACLECAPPTAEHRSWHLDEASRRSLQRIHATCRQEVEHPDRWSGAALQHRRLELDVLLARSLNAKRRKPPSAMRLELALRWMRQRLAQRDPVAGLCDYFQISPSTLQRLFGTHLRESPSNHHQRLRMERARDFLRREGMTVKQTAYALGYRHPNDFSRAFRTFTGKNPSSQMPLTRDKAARRKITRTRR